MQFVRLNELTNGEIGSEKVLTSRASDHIEINMLQDGIKMFQKEHPNVKIFTASIETTTKVRITYTEGKLL